MLVVELPRWWWWLLRVLVSWAYAETAGYEVMVARGWPCAHHRHPLWAGSCGHHRERVSPARGWRGGWVRAACLGAGRALRMWRARSLRARGTVCRVVGRRATAAAACATPAVGRAERSPCAACRPAARRARRAGWARRAAPLKRCPSPWMRWAVRKAHHRPHGPPWRRWTRRGDRMCALPRSRRPLRLPNQILLRCRCSHLHQITRSDN